MTTLTPSSSNTADSSSATLAAMDPEKQNGDGNGSDLERTQSIAETLPLHREILFVGVVVLANFTTQVGFGQGLATLFIVGDSYGITDQGQLSWLIAGYSLTIGSFILISGRFGDMFGYKRMLLVGFSWFALWSLIAGLAVFSNHVLFVFARVLQGIGPSILLPNGLALLGATYAPGRRKDMIFAIFGATAPGGAIIGALFAALFSLAWWPWAFFSFAITLAIITVVAAYAIPDCPGNDDIARKSFREKLIALDLPGAFTGITALVLFNFAWNQAPIVGWDMPYVYVCLILGLLFALAFFYVELKVVPEPLLPFHALTADVSFVLGCLACGWASFGIWVYYLWVFLLTLRHESPLLVSAQLTPLVITGALAAVCTGVLLSKIRPAWIMVLALTSFLVGNILIGTAPVHQTYWAQVFVCTILIPWGMDMSFPAATIILSNAVSKEHQGIGASLVNTVVNYSISLGLGFAGTVQVYSTNGGKTQHDALVGLRNAYYMSFSLAGFGLFLSIVFVGKGYLKDRKANSGD